MTASPNRTYFPEIDQLRGFAATLVLFYHGLRLIGPRLLDSSNSRSSDFWIYTLNPLVAVIEEGHTGVAMFIVLSGFILSLGAIGHKIDYPKFLIARFLRIYPLLIVCLTAAIISNPSGPHDLKTIIISLIPLSVADNIQSVFTVMFWAVVIELQCYLAFPFVIKLSNAFGVKALLILVFFTIVIRVFVFEVQPVGTARDLSYATIFGRFDQFLIGIITAYLFVKGKLFWVNRRILVVATVLLLLILTVFNQAGGGPVDANWKLFWPTLEASMWAFFIVSFLISFSGSSSRFTTISAKIGEISYSTYLWHFSIIVAVVHADLLLRITGQVFTDTVLTSMFIVFPITLAMGQVSYQLIEKPFLILRPKYIIVK